MNAIVPSDFLPGVTKATVPVLAMPHLDPGRGRIAYDLPHGLTILEMIRLTLPAITDAELPLVRVTLQPNWETAQVHWPVRWHVVEQDKWHLVRPKPQARVLIRVIPGKGMLGQILSIVVSVAAMALGQFYLGPAIAGALNLTGNAAKLAIGLTTAGLALAANILIGMLIPQQQAKKQSPTYGIEGWKNVFQPGMVVPALLGEHRQAPVHCAMPYSVIENGKMVSVALMTLGIGRHDFGLDDIKIGSTKITKLMAALSALDDDEEDFDGQSGLEIELRRGGPGDRRITLYEGQRIEERFDIHLLKITDGINEDDFPEEPATRVTATDITKFTVILFFPAGLVRYDDDGDAKARKVDFQIRYRPLGSAVWTTEAISYQERKRDPFFRSIERDITGPRGPAYEVEMQRTQLERPDKPNIQSRCHWIALQSFRPEYPLNFPLPLGLLALKVRASKLLNGIIDELTVQNRRVAPDWNDGTNTWITRATRSPAAAALFIMQGPATLSPLEDDEINLSALQELAEFNTEKELTYDFVHDSEGSWWEALNQTLAAGRALPIDTGEEWTVVIDKPRTKVIDHITPLESWGFRWEAPTPLLPDAFRIPFRDATDNFEPAERIVERPGFVGVPARFETLEFPGVTDPRQVYLAGYRRWLEILYRLDHYFAEVGVKQLVLTRGDMALYSHDVLNRTQIAAWVRRVEGAMVELDREVSMEAGRQYACVFRYMKSEAEETEADYPAVSLLRSVSTSVGQPRVITLMGAGPMPPVGALAMFGEAGQETIEVIVKSIESGDDFTARLELIDHAPQIDEELDAVVVPAWDRRIGEIIDLGAGIPAVPRIREILSGQEADDDLVPNLVLVYLLKGIGSSQVLTYEVRHRLNGTVDWTVETAVNASIAVVRLEDYDEGDEIEVEARANNASGSSAWTDPPAEHVVAANNDTMPVVATFVAARNPTTALWAYEWSVTDSDDLAAGVSLRYRVGTWSDWADLSPLFDQTVTVSPWDSSKPVAVDTYTFGAKAVLDDGTETGGAILVVVPP